MSYLIAPKSDASAGHSIYCLYANGCLELQSRLRQQQLRAAEQPGEPDISVTRADAKIEGIAQLNSDKPFSRNTEKRLELHTIDGAIEVDVVMSGRERLKLEAIGEKRQANISIKIVSVIVKTYA